MDINEPVPPNGSTTAPMGPRASFGHAGSGYGTNPQYPESSNPVDISDIHTTDLEVKDRSESFMSAMSVASHQPLPNLPIDESMLNSRQALTSLLKSTLGTGLLGLPMAFKHAGLVLSPIFTAFIIFLQTYCIRMVVKSSHHYVAKMNVESMDYANVVKFAAISSGPAFLQNRPRIMKMFVNFLIFLNAWGCLCVYNVFMADNLNAIYSGITSQQWMAILLLPLMLIVLIKHLKSLHFLALATNVLYLIALCCVVFYLFSSTVDDNDRKVKLFNGVTDLPLFFGTVIFSFEAIGMILPIENQVADKKAFIKWNGPVGWNCLAISLIYALFGFFGYYTSGEKVEDSITLNLPKDNMFYDAVRGVFVVVIFVTYAYQFYAPIVRIDKWLARRPLRAYPHHVPMASNVLRIVAIAEVLPHLNLLMSLFGSVAGSLMCFILPCIVEYWTLKDRKVDISWKDTVILWSITIFGIMAMVFGTISSFAGFATASS